MSFGSPWAWLWVLAVIPVAILYFLRRRERKFPVSALFLWEGIRPDRPHLVERLRRRLDLLFFLQILGVVLFAFSLSQPALKTVRPGGATLLVLDGSASTMAQVVAEEIRAKAKEVIAGSAGPWALIKWADPPELLGPPTSSRAEALAALSHYQPSLTRRVELAQALAIFPEPWPRVVVITDNPEGIAAAEVVQVARPENLAITAFSVRPTPDGIRYEAFLQVLNATERYQDVQIRLRTETGEFWASRLFAPGAEEDLIMPISGVRAGAFVAELLPADAFPWDNVRYFAFSSAGVRVRWEGPEDRYLWAALRAAAPVVRARTKADLVVAFSCELPVEPDGPAFLVAAGTPDFPRGKLREAGPLRSAPSPFLAHLSPSQFRLTKMWEIALPTEAQVVLWAGDLPLLAVVDGRSGRRVFFAADLPSSNLPLLPDFPILVRNVLGWLLPEEPAPLLVVGESLRLPPGFQVLAESGPVEGVWVPSQPGIFELRRPQGRGFIAVNVPWEASRRPSSFSASASQTSWAPMTLPVWPWVLALLLPVLLGEAGLFLGRGG